MREKQGLMMDDKKEAASKRPKKSSAIGFKTLFQKRDSESTIILFIVPIILILWVYYGKQADFDQLFKGFQGKWNQDFFSAIYEYFTAFLLMFWVPYFIIKMVFKKKLSDFGCQFGDVRYGLFFVLITPLVTVLSRPSGLPTAKTSSPTLISSLSPSAT